MRPRKLTNILLFGETGNGKSSLVNCLLGDNVFKVSADVKAETKVTFGREGKGDSSDLFVIDTPGLQDTEGADRMHMIQLIQYVKEHKELNAIIVVFNYQQVRFPYNIQTMLKLFCNIFPMKDVGKHIALVFTKSFTKRGILTNEQKLAKSSKVLPEFRRVIKEASGTDLSNNIPTAFVDIDPDEGIDENGKIDLERLKAWANFLPNLNVEEFKAPEPEVKIESQDFEEMRIEGEYIIKTIIKKEREVYCQ
jgi:tRNA U34 5-carboxymethylaminomethyl modifying GTPase MnmE/TrmE